MSYLCHSHCSKDIWNKIFWIMNISNHDCSNRNIYLLKPWDNFSLFFSPAFLIMFFFANVREYVYTYVLLCAGLDEGEQNHNDPVTVQGAYLSFLHLRHLKIRDLQRSVSNIPAGICLLLIELLIWTTFYNSHKEKTKLLFLFLYVHSCLLCY